MDALPARVEAEPPSARLLNISLDIGTGPPLILVHGIASSHVVFQVVIPELAASNRVIAVDLLGFGLSPAPIDATYTVEEHVAYLHRTIRSLRLRRPAIIVGHSMGCLIASRYARRHPSAVAGLVLVSPPIYLPAEIVGDPVEREAMVVYRRFYDFVRDRRKFTIRNAEIVARLLPVKDAMHISDRNWRAFVLSLEHTIETQTAVTDIAETRCAIHVIYGTLDPFLIPGSLTIVSRMCHVSAHKVRWADHLIRRRTAAVLLSSVKDLQSSPAPSRVSRLGSAFRVLTGRTFGTDPSR